MLLAIDIGNTRTKVGLFEGLALKKSYRLSSIRDRTSDEYAVLLKGLLDFSEIRAVIIASVVPPVGMEINQMVRRYWGFDPVFVSPVAMNLMPMRVDYPKEVGVDRVVNAYAARKDYQPPVIVVDFGTTTNFDIVSADGAYEGGAIAGGVEMVAEALYQKTAQLPRVRLKKPEPEIGKNTRAAIQIGLYEGMRGQVEFILRRFKQVLGEQTQVIATGSLAEEMARECPSIDKADPEITLRGLAMIYQDRIEKGSLDA